MMKKETGAACKRTENGDILQIYFNQIKSYPLLDFSEELELSRLVGQGNNEALHKLVNANLRLVVKIARPYVTNDVSFLDLIQEGNMGLIRAAEKYDHTKNIRFSTYAGWWIRQCIVRFLHNKRRIVRLPHRKEEMLRRIQRSYHTLSQTLMHQPRTQDIAGELGVPVKDIDYILCLSSGPLPLESDNGRGEGDSVAEIHEDYTYNPERDLFRKYYHEGARNILGRLQDREKQVLSCRYQLEGGEPHTLKGIGDMLNLSPETIRQIERKALAKIRRNVGELERIGLLEAM
jgi:RNA polymerase primary sigma factor